MSKQTKKQRWRKRIVLLCFMGLLGAGLHHPMLWAWLLDASIQKLEEKTGWQVVTSSVLIDPWAGAFTITAPSLDGEDGRFLLSAAVLEGDFSFWGSLVARAWVFESINLQAPRAEFVLPSGKVKKIDLSLSKIDPSILEEIPVIQTRNLNIEDGSIQLSIAGTGDNRWDLSGLNLVLAGDGDNEQLEGEVVFDALTWQNKDGVFYYEGKKGLLELDVANWLHPEEIRLKGFEVQGQEGAVKVSGVCSLLPGWVPNYQVTLQTEVDLEEFFSQPPRIAPVSGKADVVLTWLGEAKQAPHLRGKAFIRSLEIDNRKIGTLDLDYHGDLKNLTVSNGTLQAGGTTLSLFGSAKLQAPFQFSVDVVGDNVSLYQVFEDVGLPKAWVDLSANLHVYGEGQVLPRFSFQGQSIGVFNEFKVFSEDARAAGDKDPMLYVPQLRLTSNVAMTPEFFEFKDAVFEDGKTRIRTDAKLYFDNRDGLDLEAFAPVFHFGTIDRKVAGLDFSGNGKVWAQVKGPYNALKIGGRVELEDFVFEKYRIGKIKSKLSYAKNRLRIREATVLKGRSQLKGQLSLHFKKRRRRGKKPLVLSTHFKLQNGYMEDLQNIIPVNPRSGVMDVIKSLPLSGAISGETQMSGNIAGGQTRFLVGKGHFEGRQGTKLLKQKLSRWNTDFALTAEQFILERFQGNMGAGRLHTTLRISRAEGDIQGRIRATGLRMAQLDLNEELPYGLRGVANFRGTLSGQAQNPLVTGRLEWENAALGPMQLGALSWELTVKDKRLELGGQLWGRKGTLLTRLGLRAPFEFVAAVEIDKGSLSQGIWPAAWAPDGWTLASTGIQGSWTGSIKKIEKTTGKLELSGFEFGRDKYRYQAAQLVKLRSVGKTLVFDQASFKGSDQQRLSLAGSLSSRRLDLRTEGALNPKLFEAYIPKVESFSGLLKFNLGLTGSSSAPRVTGRGSLESGQLKLSFFPDALEEVNGAFSLRGRELVLGPIKGRANGAPVTATGTVQHRGVNPTFYDVSINYNSWEGRYPSWLASKSDGRLRVVGVAQQPTLTGEIKVQSARYEDNLGSEEFLPEFRTRLSKIQSYQKEEEGLKLDVHLMAERGIFVRNNLLNAELKADLFITGTEERIGLKGVVQALEGQANVRGNRYRLQRGNIDFVESFSIAPRLDIEAETRIKDYDVTAYILGPLEDLRIKFDSKPNLSEIDVLSLVTLGFTQRELKDAAGTAGAAGLEMVSAYTGLDQELKRLIPSSIADTDALSLDELRLTTAFSERDGSNVPAVVMGVELFDGMRLRIQSTLLEDAAGDTEQKMELEQRLQGKLRWRLVWDSAGESSIGDAGADMWYRWEF